MPWFIPWSDVIKKKVCRYLLQRYLGQFLDEKLSLEQLNVDLYNGTGTVSNIALYSKSLNELCESQKWPVEVVEGHLGSVTVNVPWNALMSEDGYIEVANLYLAVKPRPIDVTDGKSVLESMFSSMSSSMQLAQDCIEREQLTPANLQATAMEGLEKFAMTIDNVLNRIKAKLINTELRIEYILPEEGASNRGLALIIKVGHIEYENEAGKEMKTDEEASALDKDFDEESVARGSSSSSNSRSSSREQSKEKQVYYLSAYAMHHITMADISIFTEEFTIVEQHQERSSSSRKSPSSDDAFMESAMGQSDDRFYSTISEFPIPSLQPSVIGSTDTYSSSNASTDGGDDDEEGDGPRGMKIYSSGELQIAALNGPHEIRLSMKQSDSVLGPNVELEVNFGVLELLLGPRQCHMLNVISASFSPNVLPERAEKKRGSKEAVGKGRGSQMNYKEEMSDFHSRRSQFNNMSGGFTYGQSLHSHNPQEEDWPAIPGELRSNLIGGGGGPDVDSLMSSSSSMSSSMSSASTMVSRNSRRTVTMGQEYDSVLISTHICRIGGIVGILLHDDILMDTESSAVCYGPPLTESSCQQMKILCGSFFGDLKKLNMVAELRQIEKVEEKLNSLVSQYHLRLLLATIILEGEEMRSPKENLLRFTASVVKGRLMESLGATKVPLLDFYRSQREGVDFPRVPDIQMTYQSLQKVHILNGIEYLSEPVVKCGLKLSPCLSELDVSIYDRLKVLSESYPFQVVISAKGQGGASSGAGQRRRKKNSSGFTFKLEFELIDVHLRFPVSDLRPVHDPQRVPWWERNVRSDYLIVQFKGARFANVRSDFFSIEAFELVLFYVENDVKIPLGSCGGKFDPNTQTNPCPTILIDLSEVPAEPERRGEEMSEPKTPPSPFARSRTCRESDTPHRKCPTEDSEILVMPGNREELKTFTEFALKHSKTRLTIDIPSANIQIKSKHIYEILYNRINADLLLWTPGSHQMVIPASNSGVTDLLFNVGLMDSVYASSVCQDIRASDSDSDEGLRGDDSEESDELYSFHGQKGINQRRRRRRRRITKSYEKQTNDCDFAFCLQVDEAVITMFPPARNAHNQVIPEQHGELLLRAEKLKLLSVKGFCGNENLGYVCLDADGLSASHCGLTPLKSEDSKKGEEEYLMKTLYPTPEGLTLNGIADHQSSRKMLSMAIQMRLCPEQEMKRLRLAAVVHTATLKHNPTVSEQSWLMELMDMFDVLDYPIPGYKPNGVITEMHIHLWDCAIDYRPLYFPFRAVATLGNLEISTNITSPSMGCTVRFVAEDSALSLGPQLVPDGGDREVHEKIPEDVAIFNDKRDLVCVLELGLFEISLRLNDRETSLSPKFDLRAAVHDVHLRTCSDSARALAEFLGYLAAEGDLNHKSDDEEDPDHHHHESEFVDNETMDLLSAKQRAEPDKEMVEVAQTKQRHVTNLMEEAMIESRRETLPGGGEDGSDEEEEIGEEEEDEFGDEMFLRTGTEVFFFPDEGAKASTSKRSSEDDNIMGVSVCLETLEGRSEYNISDELLNETLPQVQEDLGEIPSHSRHFGHPQQQEKKLPAQKLNSSDADEDYCIIGDEEKVAFEPPNQSEPVHLAEEPIRIVDNHFTIPQNKTDLLSAPLDFPMAIVRYTLCEMTITWHLYGGSDFGRAGNVSKPATAGYSSGMVPGSQMDGEGEVVYLGMSDAYRQGVSYSHGAPKRGLLGDNTGPSLTWKTSGGPDRRHDVLIEFQLNRVRFSHETYPQTTKQASRQVLLVHEFEIRDKLAVSNINKLLYNDNKCNAFGPLRSPRHMLTIEAVHIRPDCPLPAQECCLRVSLSPLRLNIDQDSLLFLFGFFSEFSGSAEEGEGGVTGGGDVGGDALNSTERTTLVDPPAPVLMVELPDAVQELQARKMVSENLKLLMDEEKERLDAGSATPTSSSTITMGTFESSSVDESTPTYFRSVRFEPAVKIRIDYHGKRVELSRGPLAGLIMGLGQLQASEFKLKAIRSKQGFLGLEALLNYFIRMWLQDIKKNQLPSILSGVGPMNAFVQLFQGIFDLFWMPIEQYKKDGKLVRGFQRGAKSFTARTALAALEITTRLIYILQLTAETAYDMVSPGPRTLRSRCRGGKRGKKKKNRVQQPQDIREGVVNAYHIVRDGIGETVQNIIDVAALEHDQKGYTGAVGAVVREIPSTMVRPIVLATQATNYVLGGVKNQLVPDARSEAKEKWKADED